MAFINPPVQFYVQEERGGRQGGSDSLFPEKGFFKMQQVFPAAF
jgi:hypothetical protein